MFDLTALPLDGSGWIVIASLLAAVIFSGALLLTIVVVVTSKAGAEVRMRASRTGLAFSVVPATIAKGGRAARRRGSDPA
jgi:hypothetical protein